MVVLFLVLGFVIVAFVWFIMFVLICLFCFYICVGGIRVLVGFLWVCVFLVFACFVWLGLCLYLVCIYLVFVFSLCFGVVNSCAVL